MWIYGNNYVPKPRKLKGVKISSKGEEKQKQFLDIMRSLGLKSGDKISVKLASKYLKIAVNTVLDK